MLQWLHGKQQQQQHTRLNAVEKRAAFDIHKYGSEILDCFPAETPQTELPFQAGLYITMEVFLATIAASGFRIFLWYQLGMGFEEILDFGNRLRYTHCREFLFT